MFSLKMDKSWPVGNCEGSPVNSRMKASKQLASRQLQKSQPTDRYVVKVGQSTAV